MISCSKMKPTLTLLVLVLFNQSSLAQNSSTDCEKKYQEWSRQDSVIIDYFSIPKINGGIKSIYQSINYPELAAKSGKEGSATVWLVVNSDGRAECVRFVKLSDEIFRLPILNAVKKQKFEPANFEEQSIDMVFLISLLFQKEK